MLPYVTCGYKMLLYISKFGVSSMERKTVIWSSIISPFPFPRNSLRVDGKNNDTILFLNEQNKIIHKFYTTFYIVILCIRICMLSTFLQLSQKLRLEFNFNVIMIMFRGNFL